MWGVGGYALFGGSVDVALFIKGQPVPAGEGNGFRFGKGEIGAKHSAPDFSCVGVIEVLPIRTAGDAVGTAKIEITADDEVPSIR